MLVWIILNYGLQLLKVLYDDGCDKGFINWVSKYLFRGYKYEYNWKFLKLVSSKMHSNANIIKCTLNIS